MAKTVLTPKIIKIMVGFGNYLNSEERKKSFPKSENSPPVAERLKLVHDNDLANFLNKEKITAKIN